MDPDPHTRTRTRTRTRRRSTCHRHPNEPITGLCALCLRDRLTVLDSSTSTNIVTTDQFQPKHETIVSFPLSRRTRGHAAGSASSSTVPELRRSKSLAVEKSDIVNDIGLDLRRKSCDVRVCNNNNNNNNDNRLTDLFDIDNNDNSVEEEEEEGDLLTMKEHIESEMQIRKKKFWVSGSGLGLTEKLRKWRHKLKEKKDQNNNNSNSNNNRNSNNDNDNNKRSGFIRFKEGELQCDVVDDGYGRRSCDVAPRMSVEEGRFSYDEHRASWDGYMVARTIPRLTPMLPIVDDMDMILAPVSKRVMVKEEGSSSCGASAKSNSDSCSSNTGSSSSSIKSFSSKAVTRRNDVFGQETKLVITEREFNDWHLGAVNDRNLDSSDSNVPVSARRTVKNGWRKVSSLWSYKSKHSDKKNGSYVNENRPSLNQNSEINGVGEGDLSGKLVRNSSYVGSRNKTESRTGLEGGRHSLSDIESGLMRLHFSTFGKSRKKLAPSMVTDD